MGVLYRYKDNYIFNIKNIYLGIFDVIIDNSQIVFIGRISIVNFTVLFFLCVMSCEQYDC